MEISSLAGNLVFSLFLSLNIFAMYVFMKRRISLAPQSEINHSIVDRFDSVDDLTQYHEQHIAIVSAKGSAAVSRFHRTFNDQLKKVDPLHAKNYPQPFHRFDDLVK